MTTPFADAQARYDELAALGLTLNLQRGQPSDADFALSDGLLSAVTPGTTTQDGLDLRNYPGGVAGLPAARALFGRYLGLDAANTVVWNNSSLELQGLVLGFALLHGVRSSRGGWVHERPRMVVTTPGYDRHFDLLSTLGFELVAVAMQPDGPDVAAIAAAASDPRVKGVLFVPTYANPGGETISPEQAARLASIEAAAPDFTIFADDAYRAHHLGEPVETVDLVGLCAAAGRPDRAFVFGSTSKITYAGAGLGFVGSSVDNIAWLTRYLAAQSIGPNKVEQARHVRFLEDCPGGLEGLMRAHAALIAPKFAVVDEVLGAELGLDGSYATWTTPRGGYFSSLFTTAPVASRVVELAKAAGVSLTPAGATYPGGHDPENRNIRIAPTRPPLDEVRTAMRVAAACVRLATEEHRAGPA
ncbi:aminotransferase class I/II-fold pyridoxal phosphate-dependent enzyme [Propionicimonas sp.]|uniref:aminotransferase class I/II-fold pyridoxal phosphate-dependent enzyme n=1 Tax=Propionicimonas sp. TaxID=1955623 RepID=UPI0039E5C847